METSDKIAQPRRPLLMYHGGKWKIASWIISHFPPHQVYVEPFGGGASVLLQKTRSPVEVYNDLDDVIVTLFRVLRDQEKAKELVRRVELTPYARREFDDAWNLSAASDDIDIARRVIVRSFFGYGASGATKRHKVGFLLSAHVRQALSWRNYPKELVAIIDRLCGVCIENRPAVEVIRHLDSPSTLFYVDPPYLASVRGKGDIGAYRHEMTEKDHRALAEVLRNVSGFVVLSGYRSPLYDELYADWPTRTKRSLNFNAELREEFLWLSPRTAEAIELPLFRQVSAAGSLGGCSTAGGAADERILLTTASGRSILCDERRHRGSDA